MKTFFARKKLIWIVVAGLMIFVIGYMLFGGNGNNEENTITTERRNFIKEVSISGKVVASESVDLSFSQTGRISNIFVKVGDEVETGQVIANLSNGTLQSELLSAQANLSQKLAENSNTVSNLEKVTDEQNTLVASSYSKMLSTDLAAVPAQDGTTATPPTITGLYTGPEGRYKIRVRRDFGAKSNFELLTFEVDKSDPIDILENEPTKLGNFGLYAHFPDTFSNYAETNWYITIPNTKSASYLSNYNAYQEAVRTRDREIANAQAEVIKNNSGINVSEAEIQSAQAEVARVQAELAERTIVAPFSGIITAVDVKQGEIASTNDSAISLISTDTLQIESFVPEIHIPFIKIGDPALVNLDAYGVDVPFYATVLSIDPAETIRDGVSTYKTKLEFSSPDPRIKSGMTANVVITTENKLDVISIPQKSVINKNNQKFVYIKNGESFEERKVMTGSISSFGEVEIISGLNVGEKVFLSPQTIIDSGE